jgi:hypothetical protein
VVRTASEIDWRKAQASDEPFDLRSVILMHALGGNRPKQGMMDAAILPVSRCHTNALVRVDI